MALQSRFLARALFLVVLLTLRSGDVLGSTGNPKAISDLKDAIVKALGFQANGLKISDFDIRDALVGQSVAYEFDLEIDDRILPFKLLEDVNRWEYVDLPIFRTEEDPSGSLVKNLQRPNDRMSPVLAPFQLVGPMELWIQDAKDMRLSLPHDVDAGVLKKVVLADGAVVTVKGARSVSLRHPLDLPLPFPLNQNQSQSSFASGLLTIANRLRQTSRTQGSQPLSLRIVGPTSLASSPSSSSNSNKLKLKRLAPGLVELSSSPSRTNNVPTVDGEEGEPMTLLTPERFSTMWPLASINGSNPNLVGFEALLLSVLGERAREEGSFRLVKAEVSAQTFMKLGFGVEKALKEGGEEVKWEAFPEWRTRPESLKMRFELLAKVDGEKVVPERVVPLKPLEFEDATADNVLTGNFTMSRTPVVHTPSDPFTL